MTIQRSARPSLGILPIASDGLDLLVEVTGVYILVQVVRGAFRVTYQKASDCPRLVLESECYAARRKHSPAALTKFRRHAWRLANDTANELGGSTSHGGAPAITA
jgi:hypothetical protein